MTVMHQGWIVEAGPASGAYDAPWHSGTRERVASTRSLVPGLAGLGGAW
jgi:ABC-type oligopeptide transport system ATPase subunit